MRIGGQSDVCFPLQSTKGSENTADWRREGEGAIYTKIVRKEEEEDVEVTVLTPGSEIFIESPCDPLSRGPVLGGLQGGRRRRRVAQGTKRSPRLPPRHSSTTLPKLEPGGLGPDLQDGVWGGWSGTRLGVRGGVAALRLLCSHLLPVSGANGGGGGLEKSFKNRREGGGCDLGAPPTLSPAPKVTVECSDIIEPLVTRNRH